MVGDSFLIHQKSIHFGMLYRRLEDLHIENLCQELIHQSMTAFLWILEQVCLFDRLHWYLRIILMGKTQLDLQDNLCLHIHHFHLK